MKDDVTQVQGVCRMWRDGAFGPVTASLPRTVVIRYVVDDDPRERALAYVAAARKTRREALAEKLGIELERDGGSRG